MNSALKQRLVGAVVLVAAAVIFLPMLLDGAGMQDRVEQAVTIPDMPDPVEPRIEEIPEPEGVPDTTVEEQVRAEAQEAEPPTAEDLPAEPDAWAVQVGSFTREDNARGLRDELREAGFEAYIQEGSSAGEAIWRVRVGPVSRESEAENLRGRLLEARDEPAIIVSHP